MDKGLTLLYKATKKELKMQNTALLLIDVQKGFDASMWGTRNNPHAEAHMKRLLQGFRKAGLTVLHAQHLSKFADSPLRPGQPGVEFMAGLEPQGQEQVFQKSVNSC